MRGQEKIPSPCTGLCTINSRSNLCLGCFRNLEEIAGWGGFNERRKREILEQLSRRQEAFGT